MNIIRINNIKNVHANAHSIEIKTESNLSSDKRHTMVILSEEDMINDNLVNNKLRGLGIDILLIPKKYKYTFDQTPIAKEIKLCLYQNHEISYY